MEKIIIPHHGRRVDCMLYRPESGGRHPMVIISHGYNGHASDHAYLGEHLAAEGIGAVALNFCGGGNRDKSGFSTTEMTLFTEKQDLLAVLDEVRFLNWVDRDRIYLFGSSQGGMVSAMAAKERRDQIRGMILKYPAFCIAHDWIKQFPHAEDIPEEIPFWDMTLGRAYVETLYDLKWEEQAEGFDRPVLIVHGTDDEVVPLSYSEQAVKRYPDAVLRAFAGEGHGFTQEGDRRMAEMTAAFVSTDGADR